MKKILLLLFLIPLFSFGQKKKKIRKRKQAKITAKANITALKDGVLLVKLSERKNSINAMKKVGRVKMAKKTEKEQKQRNKLIIAAFRTDLTFSNVYFFFSDDSKYVRRHQLDSVHFINDSLEIDTLIKVRSETFFTAKFGTVDPDAHRTTTIDREGNVIMRKSSGITITALIIMDDQLIQIAKPFPYYVREFKGLPFQRAIFRMVEKMNENLLSFYKKGS